MLVLIGLLSSCPAYFTGMRVQSRRGPILISDKHEGYGSLNPSLPRLFPRRSKALLASSMDEIEIETTKLCQAGQFDDAVANLEQQLPTDGDLKSCYVQILKSLVDRQNQVQEARALDPKNSAGIKGTKDDDDYMVHLHQADKIVQKLLELGEKSDSETMLPGAEEFNDLIKMWGSSAFAEKASVQCQSYLDTLWSLYREQRDERFVPLFESYYFAILACSAKDRGLDAAKRAESLMKDMKSRSKNHPQLNPNRSIANGVM